MSGKCPSINIKPLSLNVCVYNVQHKHSTSNAMLLLATNGSKHVSHYYDVETVINEFKSTQLTFFLFFKICIIYAREIVIHIITPKTKDMLTLIMPNFAVRFPILFAWT